MKLNRLLAGALAGLLAPAAGLFAQDSPATIAAEREEMQVNYKRISTRMDQMEDTIQNQQKKIADLAEENHKLREQLDRLRAKAESTATQDSIKQLAEKIEEVDKKRLADSELVTRKLASLGKELTSTLAPRNIPATSPTVKNDKPAAPPGNDTPERSLEYKIKDGDTLSRLVSDLRAQGSKVTQKQVMDLNPNVNWSRLRVGQVIYFPESAK